jgi:hypothetical protein
MPLELYVPTQTVTPEEPGESMEMESSLDPMVAHECIVEEQMEQASCCAPIHAAMQQTPTK